MRRRDEGMRRGHFIAVMIYTVVPPPQLSFNMIARVTGAEWLLLYSTFKHGISLQTLYRKVEPYPNSPLLLVIRDEHDKVSLCVYCVVCVRCTRMCIGVH